MDSSLAKILSKVEPVSVENETFFAEMKRLLTTVSSIVLVGGVEEDTNSATLILAKDSFARFAIFDFEHGRHS